LYPPTGTYESTAEWVAATGKTLGASIQAVDPACVVPNPLPKTVHAAVRQQFVKDQLYAYPDTFVAILNNGRVWGDGYVITPDDNLLEDVSIDFRAGKGGPSPRPSSIKRYWKLQDIVNYDGTVAVLSTDAADIYYHWLFQLLPRVELIRRSGIDLNSIDYFVVNGIDKKFQYQSMEAIGIGEDRIIESRKTPYIKASRLIVPSIPLGGGCFRPWMCDFVRNLFLNRDNEPDSLPTSSRRRIYISRGTAKYRRVLNESAVKKFLVGRGFEVVQFEHLSMWEQAALMKSCDTVVAPHGAGLCNIVFCSPRTKVLEIFSPELVTLFYWKLSNQLGLDYYYMLGRGSAHSHEADYPQSWDSHADIEVDLAALEASLNLAGIR
jgi:capsular polysaccharide biosynthesis protein